MGNLEIYEKVRAVPQEAKKTITAGRMKGFTDINPMWRIKVLTEQFGVCGVGWYFDINREWTESVGEEVCAFVDISLYVKVGGDWSKPIRGTGGSRLATKEKAGVYVSDECYKMACTDAVSVACKNLGIGADVYWEKDVTKYQTNVLPGSGQISKGQKEFLISECMRTGKSQKVICGLYKVGDFSEMNQEQFKSCAENFKKTPSKEDRK